MYPSKGETCGHHPESYIVFSGKPKDLHNIVKGFFIVLSSLDLHQACCSGSASFPRNTKEPSWGSSSESSVSVLTGRKEVTGFYLLESVKAALVFYVKETLRVLLEANQWLCVRSHVDEQLYKGPIHRSALFVSAPDLVLKTSLGKISFTGSY